MRNFYQILVVAVFGLFAVYASSQTIPQIIITSQANNFYPANYPGKALVAPNSNVSLATELLRNNKLVDVSQANFSWVLDGKLLGSGRGLKETSFTSKKQAGDNHLVKVSIELGGEKFENSQRIDVFDPVVVIEKETPGDSIRANEEINLQAMPYFFSVSSLEDLKFLWRVGDTEEESKGENRLILSVGRAFGALNSFRVSVTVQNNKNPLEFKNGSIQLKILR